jgi:hypothetical protein
MISAGDVRSPFELEAQRSALAVVLGSKTFSKNQRLTALLEYLCERHFQGQTESIKEYNIATDVFDRPPDFDQASDAIVRVEMHRLRKKLKEFYACEGAEQALEIVIPSGHYLPEFVARRKDPEVIGAAKGGPSPSRSEVALSRELLETHGPRVSVWLAFASGIVVVTLVLAALISWKRIAGRSSLSQNSHLSTAMAMPISPAPVAIRSGEGARIVCGSTKSAVRDRSGSEWDADAFYSGGTPSEIAAQPIYRTRDPFLFRSMRSGEFSYKIPLKPGVYEMRLYFADTSYAPGDGMDGGENLRVFTVLVNGIPILRAFDIIADAGASTADVKVFKDIAPARDGYLHLAFSKVTGTPMINAIEIVPGMPYRLRPTQIIMQDSTLLDRNGGTWRPDNYFLGGRTIARFGTVTGPEDPQIYAGERYGNFSYAIPVANGRYAARLRFSETYWGPENPGGGGRASRIFDVYCNGTALLRNFDMFEEAGAHHQLVKTFHGLQANAQGKLLFSFIPQVNYANVSAIEVIDETKQREP